jgi:gamma-glutamyltranspeptidase
VGPYSPPYSTSSNIQTTSRYVKVTLNLTASSNLTMYSVPPPGSGAVLAAILNIIQHSDNFQVYKGALNLTASNNLTMYSVPPPSSGVVLAAILNIVQHSDNFQVCKGHAEPDRQQQPDHVQRAATGQRGRPRRHTQHHPAFKQLPGM